MSDSEGSDANSDDATDVDTLESEATVETESGRRYKTLTANKSGEVTSDDE
jgi:hypothetical protein